MALDISPLIAPLDGESPAGPDLSYDAGRQLIEAAFEKSVSQDAGEDDSSTDWQGVIAQITAQAEQTRDIWLPVYLMRASAHAKRFDLLVDSAELLAGLVEELWPSVHPQLDEFGFIGRKAPCESLTRIGDFLGPLSRVPLLEHPRLGQFSGADLVRFHEKGSAAEGFGMFRALIEATSPDDLAARLAQVDALRTALHRLDGVMTANAEGDTATNFKPTYDLIDSIRAALAAFVPGETAHSGNGAIHPALVISTPASAGNGVMPTAVAYSGAIGSRDDVIRALDAICAYYAANEPGSPVPLALARARAWIGLDFMAVLEDIAPGSMDEAGRVLRGQRGEAPAEISSWDTPTPEESEDSSW